MRADIETAKSEGANGVVIGLLTEAGEIDAGRTRELVALARPLGRLPPRVRRGGRAVGALETLIELGVDRVLTSGQEATVLEGLPLIVEFVKRAGDRIVIMPGAESPRATLSGSSCGAAARDPFRRTRAGRERHAISPPACVHGRRTQAARIRPTESSAATIGEIVAKASGGR